MPTSPYVSGIRERIGHDLLLLPAVTAVIRRDDRFLLCRRVDSSEWGLVGGGVEPGEDPKDAVLREVREELGVRVDIDGLVGAYGGEELLVRYANDDVVSYVTTAFLCSIPDGSSLVFTDGELAETGWFAIDEIAAMRRARSVDRILADAIDPSHTPAATSIVDKTEDPAVGVNPLAVAARFVTAHYPGADVAIVAGSAARGDRTATSDIDLLLLGDWLFDLPGQTSEASTHDFEGEILEVFAYTPTGFDEWAARGIAQHRPVTVHMLVDGTAIRDDGRLAPLRQQWQNVLDAGPSLSAKESAFRRYVITDVLDDLEDATDPLEQRVEASILFERIAELILLADGRWIGAGKWLPRRLRELSVERADRLTIPLLESDYPTFAARVSDELERAGGRVQAGFVR
ncbi:NUDIX domain-containing protein [Microbacterium sp. WCS2018Hpa-9]|uniref:NUDIX domain-containing protein n=1 Tax=Microbacterium sp. WCS2018Hpa-9 TaxID=3073635 RepID=UPI00288C2C7C|nr:NUDIX domain-containing protein [Microbacterium sp. WCS2018Hpa-9]